MSAYTDSIIATRDRITRALEKESTASPFELIRSGLSGAFGTGAFTKQLGARLSPEADTQRQGQFLGLLRGMQEDERADERLNMDRDRMGMEQQRVDLETIRTMAAQQGTPFDRSLIALATKLAPDQSGAVRLLAEVHKRGPEVTEENYLRAVPQIAAQLGMGDPKQWETGFDENLGLPYQSQGPGTKRDYIRPADGMEINVGPEGTTVRTGVGTSQGAPPKPPPINEAAREAMVPTSLATVQQIRDAVLAPDGGVNTGILAAMAANVAGTRGRTLRSQMEEALANLVYLKSGAQAGPNEVASAARQYMPTPLDNAQTAKDKLDRLEAFFKEVQTRKAGSAMAPEAPGEVAIPEGFEAVPGKPNRIRRIADGQEFERE